MVPSDANQIASFDLNLVMTGRIMAQHADDVMTVLTTVVVDVIKRLKPVVSVRVKRLHDLKMSRNRQLSLR